MKTDTQIKDMVRAKYAAIAMQSTQENQTPCCGAKATSGGNEVYNIMADDYTALEGYNPEADLGLGCGLPTEFAKIREGDTVIDLGSGAGNDCFIARSIIGEEGKVIGIDFTEPMIKLATKNAEQLGFKNVEFRQGDIEHMPVSSDIADVVVSNCVLNLVPDKKAVFQEIFRVLKPRAHFCISDIVLTGELPAKWKEVAELYAGCVSGAIQKDAYLAIIEEAGFNHIIIQKENPILIPENILEDYLSRDEIASFQNSGTQIVRITVFAEKPDLEFQV